MKLGRQGGASLPAQASSDMAEALQKGIASLAAKHGKDISQLHREEEAAENANAHPRSESSTASANRSAEPAAKQAWEAAKANYKAPSARAITQETFDEVVQENVEDFEMELKEAIADACLQFMKQGVNLNNIIKTEAHFNVKNKDVSDHVVTIALTTVKDAVVAKDSLTAEGMDNVCAALSDLRSAFEIDEEAVPIANSNDAIGTLVTLLRTFPDASCVVPALDTIRKMCTTPHAIDQFNQFGLGPDVVLECCRRALGPIAPGDGARTPAAAAAGPAAGDVPAAVSEPNANDSPKAVVDGATSVLVAGLALIKVTALKHNGCKDQFFGRGVAELLQQAMEQFPDDVNVVRESALSFRSLVRGDGTIDSKAPTYLKELVETKGWLERLVISLLRHLRRADGNVDAAAACAYGLEAVAINEKACTEAADLGTITALLESLQRPANMTNVVYARRAASLLGALARSDKNKELIGQGVPTFSEVMIKNAADHTVQKAFLSALTAICLRQPAIAEAIVAEKGHHLAVSAMRMHPSAATLQRAACMLLRNLGSRSPDVRVDIAEVGAEKFLRAARANHSLCEDVAYAALRDLGFQIEGMRTYKVERPMHGMFTDAD